MEVIVVYLLNNVHLNENTDAFTERIQFFSIFKIRKEHISIITPQIPYYMKSYPNLKNAPEISVVLKRTTMLKNSHLFFIRPSWQR